MGKRKGHAPQHVDETKRKTLSWDMTDLSHDVHIYRDDDPNVLAEQRTADRILENLDLLERLTRSEENLAKLDQRLQELLDNSEFYMSVRESLLRRWDIDWLCKLGQFTVKIQPRVGSGLPPKLPQVSEFWIYVLDEPMEDTLLIYYELDGTARKSVIYFEATSDLPHECLKGLQWSSFRLVLGGYDPLSGEIMLNLHLLKTAQATLRFPAEGIPPSPTRLALAQLMAHLHNFTTPDLSQYPSTQKHDINLLYEAIKARHDANPTRLKVNVQHPSLKPKLRDYQKQAVLWMLSKEHYQASLTGHVDDTSQGKANQIHPLYEEFHTPDGQLLFYNKHGGIMVREKPLAEQTPPGGILADEMGLGKTVEVLACILCHPRPGLLKPEPLPIIKIDYVSQTVSSQSDPDLHVNSIDPEYMADPEPKDDPEPLDDLEVKHDPEPVDALELKDDPEPLDALEVKDDPEPLDALVEKIDPEPLDALVVNIDSEPLDALEVKVNPEPLDALEVKVDPEPLNALVVKVDPEPLNALVVKHDPEPLDALVVKDDPEPLDALVVKDDPEPLDALVVKDDPEPLDALVVKDDPEPLVNPYVQYTFMEESRIKSEPVHSQIKVESNSMSQLRPDIKSETSLGGQSVLLLSQNQFDYHLAQLDGTHDEDVEASRGEMSRSNSLNTTQFTANVSRSESQNGEGCSQVWRNAADTNSGGRYPSSEHKYYVHISPEVSDLEVGEMQPLAGTLDGHDNRCVQDVSQASGSRHVGPHIQDHVYYISSPESTDEYDETNIAHGASQDSVILGSDGGSLTSNQPSPFRCSEECLPSTSGTKKKKVPTATLR